MSTLVAAMVLAGCAGDPGPQSIDGGQGTTDDPWSQDPMTGCGCNSTSTCSSSQTSSDPAPLGP